MITWKMILRFISLEICLENEVNGSAGYQIPVPEDLVSMIPSVAFLAGERKQSFWDVVEFRATDAEGLACLIDRVSASPRNLGYF